MWRRDGARWQLLAAVIAAWAAGGIWSLGYAAGPIGSIYLLASRAGRNRRPAGVLIAVAVLSLALNVGIGGWQINASAQRNNNLHGLTFWSAFSPAQGLVSAFRVMPLNLVFGNLGVDPDLTANPALTISLALATAWVWLRVTPGRATPMECAGAAMILIGYTSERSVRGYLPFLFVRRVYFWYDIVPHLGAVLFAAGWWCGQSTPAHEISRTTWSQAVAVLLFLAFLLSLHVSRLEWILESRQSIHVASAAETALPPSQRRARALRVAAANAERQRIYLVKLEHAEEICRTCGIGREMIKQLFPRVLSPSTPEVDDADLLDLPENGTETETDLVRTAIGPLMGSP
jgi:hypothetical protein